MKFILGKKLNMTQVFKDDGDVIPVTAITVGFNVITGIKTKDKDGYSAIQLGTDKAKEIKKPQAGHLKGLSAVKTIKEFRVADDDVEKVKFGDVVDIKTFEPGDMVKVTGTTKGKGFQGVVKRHGFKGGPASHGHKDQERMPGSIGATDAARVFKGKKMPGQMGNAQVTISGLEVIEVDAEKNIIYVKGAVPGARNGLLLIGGPGEAKIEKIEKVEKVNDKKDIKEKKEPQTKLENKEDKKEDKVAEVKKDSTK